MTKKVMFTAAVAVLAAGVASADLSVSWGNVSVAVTSTASGDFINDNLVQLLWSAGGNTTVAGGYNVLGGATQAGEFVLLQTTDHSGTPVAGIGMWNPIAGVWGNADVGGADINAGFFFTRVFQTAGAEAGTSFYDTLVVDSSAWVLDVLVPGTVYGGQAILDVPGGQQLGITTTDGRATTVIPEPATFGLMGLAGLGLFLARKKARR